MLDPRWEEDTLFLIFEEDFRFRQTESPGRRPATELTALPGSDTPGSGARGSGDADLKVVEKNPQQHPTWPCEPTALGHVGGVTVASPSLAAAAGL